MKRLSIKFKNIFIFISFVPLIVSAEINSEFKTLVQSFTEERQTTDKVHCGFINYVTIQQIRQYVDPAMQILGKQAKINERPTRQDSVKSRPDGHFMMHFDWTGRDSVPSTDISDNGIPDFVDSAGVYLEKAWDVEINQLGFRPPPGNDGKPIEVYPV